MNTHNNPQKHPDYDFSVSFCIWDTTGFSEMMKDDVKKKALLHLNGPGKDQIIAVLSIME